MCAAETGQMSPAETGQVVFRLDMFSDADFTFLFLSSVADIFLASAADVCQQTSILSQ